MKTYPDYQKWIKRYDALKKTDLRLIKFKIKQLLSPQTISLFLPVNTLQNEHLLAGVVSLQKQLHPHWKVFIFIDAAQSASLDPELTEIIHQDPKIQLITFNAHTDLAAVLNKSMSLCAGKYLGLLSPHTMLPLHALYMMANEISQHPEAQLIYADDDRLDENGERTDPYFKPDWNPDLFLSQNYPGDFCLYHLGSIVGAGGFHSGFSEFINWDLAMRVTEVIPAQHVRHIPFVLSHQQTLHNTNSEKHPHVANRLAQKRILSGHFTRINVPAKLCEAADGSIRIKYHLPQPEPLVSIIIPTKNEHVLLKKCLNSIFSGAHYQNFEILIVNNQSDDPQTLDFLSILQDDPKITVLHYDHAFNYAAINNFAAQLAQGDVLVFLNNDIEVISLDWLEEMVSQAIRPEIGAVGAKLFYPNNTIQHARVILGLGGVAGHIYLHEPQDYQGQRGRAELVQNYLAVTGACMAIERDKFEQAGGFDQTHLPIAYNDIDLCLRLIRAGYRNIWTPYAKLYHHESATRGYEDTPYKKARLKREGKYLISVWGEQLINDPAYNLNLSVDSPDFSLAYPPRVTKPWLASPGLKLVHHFLRKIFH